MGITHAYLPTTWIKGVPNNIYNPLSSTDAFKEDEQSARHIRFEPTINFFALTQQSQHMYGQCSVYGLGLQSTLFMDNLLPGLYSTIATAVLTKHDRVHGHSSKIRHTTSSSLSDTTIALGWKALSTPRLYLSGYLFGIIPAPHHSLRNSSNTVPWIGLDNHFVGGAGLETGMRLCGTARHHLDLLTDAQVLFLTDRQAQAWVKKSQRWVLHPIKIHAHELYKLQPTLIYQWSHFISDLGIQYFYMPEPAYTDMNGIHKHLDADRWCSLMYNIGATISSSTADFYCTVGAQLTGRNQSFDMWGSNLKCCLRF